tara:strand:+ start:397 stop:1002 length:606 start_codon:yes stop_codon:yes gene_type:complete
MLEQFYEPDKIELGLDEAGRGCLFGPVCVAGVIWVNEDPNPDLHIKDSKKMSEKKRKILREYIESNAVAYNIQFICSEEIDKINILEASILGMNQCIDEIVKTTEIDTILIDGPQFNFYDGIPHVCINGGDNKYKSIAAASILAKTHRDEWIENLVRDNPELEKYGLLKNKGYGTKEHLEAIKKYGITQWHRKTFGICKKF